MPDWKKLKAEYISTETSYRKLAAKYGVSPSVLYRRMAKEKWADLRKQKNSRADAKIIESVASREAKAVATIQDVADLLLQKIREGVESGMLIMDSQSIRQITASIKDLRDIKGAKSELDMQEQMARIERLRKDVAGDDTDKEIKVVISSDLEQYSK